MRHDMVGATVETEDDVDLYCRRVAGAVGVMVAQISGAKSDEAERRITALGIGVQRAHILRDIDLDRLEGRCYIAGETVKRFGSISPGHRELLLKDQIARADAWLDEGVSIRRLLPEGGRAAGACASLYREILRQIEREGYGRVEACPVVPRWRRNAVIARAFLLNR
jgi:phytoene synthase